MKKLGLEVACLVDDEGLGQAEDGARRAVRRVHHQYQVVQVAPDAAQHSRIRRTQQLLSAQSQLG